MPGGTSTSSRTANWPASRPASPTRGPRRPQAERTLDTSDKAFARWLAWRNVPHRVPGPARGDAEPQAPGHPPGDTSADVMDTAAADRPLQPRRTARQPPPEPGAALGQGQRPVRALPGGPCRRLCDVQHRPADRPDRLPRRRLLRAGQCALASRSPTSWPSATRTSTSQHDIGEIDLHISGCIAPAATITVGHIGVLGVDKDGTEWYQSPWVAAMVPTPCQAPPPGRRSSAPVCRRRESPMPSTP